MTGAAPSDVVGPVLALAGLSALSMITSGTQGQVQRLLGETVAAPRRLGVALLLGGCLLMALGR